MLAQGTRRASAIPSGDVLTQQVLVFEWRSPQPAFFADVTRPGHNPSLLELGLLSAAEMTLQVRANMDGSEFNFNAGNMLQGGAGYYELTYGAGSSYRTVRFDIRSGAYQLPPCDYVKLEFAIGSSFGGAIDVTGSLVEGTFPTGRPPTWTFRGTCAGAIAIAPWAGFIDFPMPKQARALDLQIAPATFPPPAISALTVALNIGTPTTPDATNQSIYTSLDGSATYPLYSPVPIDDQLFYFQGLTQVTVLATVIDTNFLATFFIAL
jgi:hypothetical protein